MLDGFIRWRDSQLLNPLVVLRSVVLAGVPCSTYPVPSECWVCLSDISIQFLPRIMPPVLGLLSRPAA